MSSKSEPGRSGATEPTAATGAGTPVAVKETSSPAKETSAATKETASPRESAPRDAAAPRDSASAESKSGQRELKKRKGQFLVAPRHNPTLQMMGIAPLQFSVVEQALRDSPDIEIIDRVGPKNAIGALGAGMPGGAGVLVARMAEEKATALAMQSQGQLIVERDQSLQLLDVNYPQSELVNYSLPMSGGALTAEFFVTAQDKPIEGAEVYMFGSLLPARGVTDANGRVRLTLFGETTTSVRRLYVKPRMDYWSFYQEQPDISDEEINVVKLRALSDWPSLANFPKQQQLSWGQKAMRLDQLPPHFRGQGIRIAVVDSGAANKHQDLTHITHGYDIINKQRDTSTWTVDTLAHGSHCTGVIAGLDSAVGVRGFAPDAEIHACKLFPGGQISQLIDALEYCIEKQVDVVNLSLGGAEPSEALEQQLLRARQAGVACIVAAGNSGGAVQYPAASQHVLAVAAIGRLHEFPADSYHTQSLTPQMDTNGFYAARFSCFGPEIAVCAPGVAITSSVPDNNYAAWDGTSMAAPHVTGLAALILAHHPDFQGAIRMRNAQRVERLFQIIKASCRPVMVGDQRRTGFGLPDAPRAVGLLPAQQQPTAGIGSTTGMLGGLMGSPTVMQTLANAYRELPQMMPQSTQLGLSGYDPYANLLAVQQAMTMQNNLPSVFSYRMW
ncbi:MAG: S8 family serine peptidase [Oxalobacteraceae bacterium]|nr:S8 family serine peptidase [Oxalobacteraceae bacterium]